jgi:hypothetical protein
MAFSDSYLLVANSMLTAVMGMLFWVVATRQFDSADVATAGSTFALVALLVDVSVLELPSAATIRPQQTHEPLVRSNAVAPYSGLLIRRRGLWAGVRLW